MAGTRRRIQQPDRTLQGCWTEVHVALRRSQIHVTSQLLNGSSRSTTHREMRTECMSQDVNAAMFKLSAAGRMIDMVTDRLLVQGTAARIAEHERPSKMSRRLQRSG